MLDSPGGVYRMLDSPRVTRELRLTHSADANSRNGRRIVPKGTGPPLHVHTGRWAKRAVSALVVVAPLPSADATPHSAPHAKKESPTQT